ncbi:hypothetical protein Tco_0846365, partial [Tanacetum coccineum]
MRKRWLLIQGLKSPQASHRLETLRFKGVDPEFCTPKSYGSGLDTTVQSDQTLCFWGKKLMTFSKLATVEPTGGLYGANYTATKDLRSAFYWLPTIYKDFPDCENSYCSAVSTEFHISALLGIQNGYLRKGRKTKPKRQNRARNGKAGKDTVKSKPKFEKVNPKEKEEKKEKGPFCQFGKVKPQGPKLP